MSFNVIAAVMQYLPPEVVTKIAQSIGIDRAMAMKAVSAMVPAILAKLAGKAGTAEGAKALSEVFTQQDPGLLGQLGSVLGGPHEGPLIDYGSTMLKGLIGRDGFDSTVAAIAKISGVPDKQTASLIGLVAPVLSGTLARHQQDLGLDDVGLAKLLGSQLPLFVQAMPAALASSAPAVKAEVAVVAPAAVPPAKPVVPVVVAAQAATVTPSVSPKAHAAPSLPTQPAAAAAAPPVAAPVAQATVVPAAPQEAAPGSTAQAPKTVEAAVAAPSLAAKPMPPIVEATRPPVQTVAAALKDIASKAGLTPQEPVATPRPAAVPAPPIAAPSMPKDAGAKATAVPEPSRPVVGATDGTMPAAKGPVATAPQVTTAPTPAAAHAAHAAHAKHPHTPAAHPGKPVVAAAAPTARRGLPVAAYLLPLVLIGAGGAWWYKARLDQSAAVPTPAVVRTADASATDAETRARASAEAAKRAAAEASQKADAEAAAKRAADAAAGRKAEADAAAAAKLAADAASKRETEKVAAEAEARRKADAEAAKVAADAGAAVKSAADADIARKADADAAVAKAATEAKAAAEALAGRRAAAEAEVAKMAAVAAAAAEAKARQDRVNAELIACQTSVRDAASAARIQFEFANATLKSDATATLARLTEAMKACPTVHVRIEGHTDNNGDVARNQRLSESRANSVVQVLTTAGVEAGRMTAMGLGQTKPLASNDSERNRALNRRIEIVVE